MIYFAVVITDESSKCIALNMQYF